jgi:hypothetical protein
LAFLIEQISAEESKFQHELQLKQENEELRAELQVMRDKKKHTQQQQLLQPKAVPMPVVDDSYSDEKNMLQQELQSLQVFTDSVHGLVLTRILSR